MLEARIGTGCADPPQEAGTLANRMVFWVRWRPESMTDKIVVLCACDSEEEAVRVGRQLVEKKLASCVSILPQVRSIYRWQGRIEDAREFVLLIKSRRDVFDVLRAEIAKLHSYEIPEVIALPVVDGSEAYLDWLDREIDSEIEK